MPVPQFLKDILVRFGVRVLTVAALAGAVIGLLSLLNHQHEREKKLLQAEADNKLVSVMEQLGAVQGRLVKERDASKTLSSRLAAFVAAAKKGAPNARVDSTVSTKVEVKDRAKGETVTAPGAPCPSEWSDEYHRFRVSLPSGLLQRSQMFMLSGVILTDTDGKKRFTKYEFREFDPSTEKEIPTTGVNLTTDLNFVEASVRGPSRWHVRWVAAVDYRPAVGIGVQVNPLGDLTLGLLGLYKPAAPSGGIVAGHVGWRLNFPGFHSTLAVGPWVGYQFPNPKLAVGAAATIELTR